MTGRSVGAHALHRWYSVRYGYKTHPQRPSLPCFENFLLSCQEVEKPRSPFSVAGPLSQVFCLGVIAQQLNARLKFDPETKQFINSPVANLLLRRGIPRKGWEEFYQL